MKKKLFGVLSVILLFCFLLSGCRELSDRAANILNSKCDELIEYFNETAFKSEYLARWEEPLCIKVIGEYSDEDYTTLKNYINTLNALEELPEISIVDQNENYMLYFIPLEEVATTIPGYREGNWGYVTIRWNESYKIYKAYMGVPTDVTTQAQRNHIILELFTKGLGLLNDSDKYPDSIFQKKWTETQSLSDIDLDIIRMLYSTSVHTGMDKEQAEEALRPWIKAEYLGGSYLE